MNRRVDCYGREYSEGSLFELSGDWHIDFAAMFGKEALSEVRGVDHSRHGLWFCLQNVCELLEIEISEAYDVLNADQRFDANGSIPCSLRGLCHLIVNSSSSVPGAVRFRAWSDQVEQTVREHGWYPVKVEWD